MLINCWLQLDERTFESTLVIKTVKQSDFGSYDCHARNQMGFAAHKIKLEVTNKPDPPVSISVLNFTHDSVTVAWVPGFNGGLPQGFRLKYRRMGTDS